MRPAGIADLAALMRLETAGFPGDRMARRSLRRLLGRPTAQVLVAVAAGSAVGYAMVLLRKGSRAARLYSLVRDAGSARRGVGGALLAAAERAAVARGAAEMRLEVRTDNAAAIRLYERHGYEVFARIADYYEDHADALRMRKSLTEGDP
ncbi:MAG: GNAT family N-acetyltransferase [Geminicoccaceae bacterium]